MYSQPLSPVIATYEDYALQYEATVNGHKYRFQTPEIIQGFMTGASWAGISNVDGKQLSSGSRNNILN